MHQEEQDVRIYTDRETGVDVYFPSVILVTNTIVSFV